MFWRKKGPFVGGSKFKLSQVKGIDLEKGVVVIDNMTYPLDESEIGNVARFALQVMMRDLNKQINALATEYGIDENAPEVPNAAVQEVPGGATAGKVSEVPADVQAVRGEVQREPASNDGSREGGEAPPAS